MFLCVVPAAGGLQDTKQANVSNVSSRSNSFDLGQDQQYQESQEAAPSARLSPRQQVGVCVCMCVCAYGYSLCVCVLVIAQCVH
jgi:hypothetical protein